MSQKDEGATPAARDRNSIDLSELAARLRNRKAAKAEPAPAAATHEDDVQDPDTDEFGSDADDAESSMDDAGESDPDEAEFTSAGAGFDLDRFEALVARLERVADRLEKLSPAASPAQKKRRNVEELLRMGSDLAREMQASEPSLRGRERNRDAADDANR